MKIVTAQLNYTIGALEDNMAKILAVIHAHPDAGMIVFSELCVSGYYPQDLVNVPGFVEAQDSVMDQLRKVSSTHQAYIVVGYIARNQGSGKKWHNSLAVYQGGQKVLSYNKQLLPTYDVYDEFRHFEPGDKHEAILSIEGRRVGFVICEDGWNDSGADYPVNPTKALSDANVDLVVSINASPAAQHKPYVREKLMLDMATKYGWSFIYVNQVGGNDSLVFDGNTFVSNPDGSLAYHAVAWEEEVGVLEYNTSTNQFVQNRVVYPVDDVSSWAAHIELGVKDYFRKTGFSKAIIGSSGGIDSAVVLAITARALGPENVIAYTLPSQYSSDGSVSDSAVLCKNLGIELIELPIQPAIDALQNTIASVSGKKWEALSLENAQARMRGLILMGWCNQHRALLVTTGNKSEMSVGYATLYGDMNGALNPLGDLYKMEVYQLASWYNQNAGYALIPENILQKEPSAELAPGQRDQDSLPPYPILDSMLKLVIEGHLLSNAEKEKLEGIVSAYPCEFQDVLKKLELAEFKRRQAPPIIRLHPRAFGAGWQFPIAQKYQRWKRV